MLLEFTQNKSQTETYSKVLGKLIIFVYFIACSLDTNITLTIHMVRASLSKNDLWDIHRRLYKDRLHFNRRMLWILMSSFTNLSGFAISRNWPTKSRFAKSLLNWKCHFHIHQILAWKGCSSYTYLLEESICFASIMLLKVSPFDTSSQDPSFGVWPIRTGALLQGPEDGLTWTRNCRLTWLNGVALWKLVVEAG